MARLQRDFVVVSRRAAPPPHQDTSAWKRGLQPVWREAPLTYIDHWGAGRSRVEQVEGGWAAKPRVQTVRNRSEAHACLPDIKAKTRFSSAQRWPDEEYSQEDWESDDTPEEPAPAPTAKQLLQQYHEHREAAARRRAETDAARDAARLEADTQARAAAELAQATRARAKAAGVVSVLRDKQASTRRSVANAANGLRTRTSVINLGWDARTRTIILG